MDPKLKAALVALGMKPEATDEQALAFLTALKGKDAELSALKTEIDGLKKAVADAKALADAATANAATGSAAAIQAAVKLERERCAGIRKLAIDNKLDAAWADKLIERGATLAHAADLVQTAIDLRPIVSVHVGDNLGRSTLRAAMSDAILLRAGRTRMFEIDDMGQVVRDSAGTAKLRQFHERAREFRGLSLGDMARAYLSELGVPDAYRLSVVRAVELVMNAKKLADAYGFGIAALAQSTSDFTSILADASNKSLRQAYEEAPRTWNVWARRATAPDFKNINRTALSEMPTLTVRKEGGPVDYLTLSDSKETYALAEYIGGLRITRRAMVNDDLDAFSRLPTLEALAATRVEDDVAYAILTANAALADNLALFEAGSHKNIGATGVISVASLAATEKLMMVQTGPKGAAYLEIRPRFLLVPTSIYRTAQQIVTSSVDPAKNNAAINPFFNEGLVIVPSARLNASSAAVWYLAADPNQIDTVEVCFLTDEPVPVLKTETDFDTDDLKAVCRHTVAAKAIDYRGLVRNAGV